MITLLILIVCIIGACVCLGPGAIWLSAAILIWNHHFTITIKNMDKF